MSIRIVILLLLALGSAGGTAMLAQNWLASERATIMASVPKVVAPKKIAHKRILVAKTDMVVGSFVLKEKLAWQEWPEDAIGERMLKEGDVAMDDFVGSVIRSRIPAGQPVVPSALVQKGEQGFMAAVLAPGMRAITVPLSATSGVGGFVFPGDKVDLLLTIALKPKDGGNILNRKLHFTETLLKNVRVIGKDQSGVQQEGQAKVAKSATLEVTPKQAETISLAMEIGNLSLSLRGLADEETILAQDFPHVQQQVRNLEHNVAYTQIDTEQGIVPLEIQDDMSLTTDLQVNFLLQKLMRYANSQTGIKRQRDVQVHRGDKTTTEKF